MDPFQYKKQKQIVTAHLNDVRNSTLMDAKYAIKFIDTLGIFIPQHLCIHFYGQHNVINASHYTILYYG